jgi:hypothetical protein
LKCFNIVEFDLESIPRHCLSFFRLKWRAFFPGEGIHYRKGKFNFSQQKRRKKHRRMSWRIIFQSLFPQKNLSSFSYLFFKDLLGCKIGDRWKIVILKFKFFFLFESLLRNPNVYFKCSPNKNDKDKLLAILRFIVLMQKSSKHVSIRLIFIRRDLD